MSSSTRFTSVVKYLGALSTSLSGASEQQHNGSHDTQKSGNRRKQLHILYLLNDLLHHAKYHIQQSSTYSLLSTTLQPHLVTLVEAASAYDPARYPRHRGKITEFLQEWEKQYDFSVSDIQKLHDAVTNAGLHESRDKQTKSTHGDKTIDGHGPSKADIPFVMPATHGDPSAPYYELPAGNMMPYIIPNSATPINPHIVKALQLVAGRPDESLITAVKDFLKDVNDLYGQDLVEHEGVSIDIDELGQKFVRDEIGERISGEAYYGWSKVFCEKMKMRRSGKVVPNRGRSDSAEGRSLSPRKRRRYSSSERSRSRSRSRPYQRRQDSISPARMRMRSRTRSRSPPPRFTRREPSRSGSRSYSPPGGPPPARDHPPGPPQRSQAQSQPQYQAATITPQIPFPIPFPQGVALGPNGMPIPPPPPQNYTGVWPPPPPSGNPNGLFGLPPFVPPPPPPMAAYGQNSGGFQLPGTGSGPGWAPQDQREQYGRRGSGRAPPQGQHGGQYGGRGRGGRGGWRG